MSTLRLATATNVRAFQVLIDAVAGTDGKRTEKLDGDALEDEVGRFRVWAGNLGALQKGHSSLDYRLRDSPNLLSSALKLLNELEHNLNETYAVVSGARLPYEAQTSTNGDEEDENDDGFFSEEDDSDSDEPRNELKMRFEEVIDIIDNLYKLSVRIRTPSIRSRSLRASSYMPTDPETGVDILGAYAELDKGHVQELLAQLRASYPSDDRGDQAFLAERLSSSITLRRRHFKYWKRHRDKLGAFAVSEEAPGPGIPVPHEAPNPVRNGNLDAYPTTPMITTLRPTPSQKTGKTLLSGTEATHHHQSLDDIVDTKSVTSYAVTVRDLHGKGIELPPPPRAANGEKDFECPYCWIVCPARYGKGRAWKTHLLQDLQPYTCTYQDCESSLQLFRSRREWAEHEATHRKLWRCPEHATALYNSQSGLENHLRQDHNGTLPEDQIAIITKIGETTARDIRTECPICYAPAHTEGLGDLQNHIANHLERFATFALPHSREDDSDGASSVASRGSSNSQSPPDSIRTDPSHDVVVASEDALELERSSELLRATEPGQGLLSAESLQQLPDESQNRIAWMPYRVEDDEENSGKEQPEDQQLDDNLLPEHKKHFEEREAFKQHILTLPGVLSVRFYRSYGSWTGLITFPDDLIGEQAIALFDDQRFPNIEFQSKKNKSKWQFARTSGTIRKSNILNRQSTLDTQTSEHADILTSDSEFYDEEDQDTSKQAIISAADIPTLRFLYQSRRLLQRDQSVAPNDTYNQMISFFHYDLTRLKVDAIVSNTSTNFKAAPTPGSLRHAILQAGGSGLRKEARSKARIKVGQVELTHGHDLPSSWVIHAAAPTYTGFKGVGQFNVLGECYRGALRMAATYELKTIAFPCLGTGGGNFPPRVAARIALQEIREYLDSHPEHRPERIIFCIKAAIDEKAYTDFLPVFFPPTHGDLDRARTSDWSANRAALSAQILEARSQLQKTLTEMSDTYVFGSQTTACAYDMRRVDSALISIRNHLLGSKELKRSLGDLNLLCSVISTACANISEIAEGGKVGVNKETSSLWDETNTDMQDKHGFDFSTLFDYCWMFANSLGDIITRDMKEPDAMARARQVLENYGVRQKGQDVEGIRDLLDEVIHVRKSERTAPNNRKIIQVDQIPSVARLYLLGNLEAKPTMAQPSTAFNHTVCLLRDDITKLEVDAMVNSTDESFSGMGTLDRTIFKRGGPELRGEVEQIGRCKQGELRVTPGFLLPARHILHVVPPGQFRKDTKSVLRGIYREILHTAVELKASSVAMPSIGTGMLNYPRRDCASLAMEEVKRFLESAEPGNGLDKIIFVVFSSNDEFIYKSLLPIYFPPPKGEALEIPQRKEHTPAHDQAAMNIDDHMPREAEREEKEPEIQERNSRDARDAPLPDPVQQAAEVKEIPSSSKPLATNLATSSKLSTEFELSEEERLLLQLKDENMPWTEVAAHFRTDFDKHYELRELQIFYERLQERLYVSRSMNEQEEDAVVQFESHVNDCDLCSDGLFERSHKLCEQGYPLAQTILQRMEMSVNANVFSKTERRSDREKLDLPTDLLPGSMLLLSTVAQRIWTDNDRSPFVQVSRSHEVKPKDQTQQDDNPIRSPAAENANILASAAHVKIAEGIPDNDSYPQLYGPDSELAAYASRDTPSNLDGASDEWTQSSRREELHVQILDYLADDLRSRPGSYIGQNTDIIASAIGINTVLAANLLHELAAQGRVHDTVNNDTWVISDRTRGLHQDVKPGNILIPERPSDQLIDRNPEGDKFRWNLSDSSLARKCRTKDEESITHSAGDGIDTDTIADRILIHMSRAGPGYSTFDLSSDLQTSPSGVKLAITKLAEDGSVVSKSTGIDPFLLYLKDFWFICEQECDNALKASTGNPKAKATEQDIRDAIGLRWRAEEREVRQPYLDQATGWSLTKSGKERAIKIQTKLAKAEQEAVTNTESADLNEHPDTKPFTLADRSFALADQIVSCLSRKGYGLSLDDLTLELRTSTQAIPIAIRLLESDGYITSGPDAKTWILTDLGELRAVEIRVEVERAVARDTESVHQDENLSSDLSERALSYLRSLPGISENISDLATTFDTPVAELQPVLEQLGSDGLVEKKGDEFSWAATKSPGEDRRSPLPVNLSVPSMHGSSRTSADNIPSLASMQPDDPIIKNTARFNDAPASPIHPTTLESVGMESGHLSHMVEEVGSPDTSTEPGVRWTCIDERLVDARVLERAGEDFERRGHDIMLHRLVKGSEIEAWSEETKRVRIEEDGALRDQPVSDVTATENQQERKADNLATSKGSSWRDGRGARERKRTKYNRALAEDVEDELELGTASSLRVARIAKERKHKNSTRASADDIDDELEYYDGQEEDYVNDDEEPLKR